MTKPIWKQLETIGLEAPSGTWDAVPDDLSKRIDEVIDLLEIARNRPDRIGTHWESCEEQHTECLIRKMADEIERLNDLVTEYGNEITGRLMPEIDRLQARTAALESHLRWVADWAHHRAYPELAKRIEQVLADH